MLATLKDVLSLEEIRQSKQMVPMALDCHIKSLQVQDLSSIAYILINSEYSGKIPEHQSVLPAIAIEILINRAYKKNLKVF